MTSVWRQFFGIADGVEAGLAPSRLILPIGLVLLASGPVRAAFASPSRGAWLPAAISTGLLVAGASATITGYNPVVSTWIEQAATLPAAFVLAIGGTLLILGPLGWSPMLWLGVSLAAGLIGWVLAELSTILGRREPARGRSGAVE